MELIESLVVTGSHANQKLISLNVLDLLTGHVNFSGVFFFRKKPDLARLKSSLVKTLDRHPGFAGSLVNDNGRVFLSHSNVGANFSVYQSDEACPDLNNLGVITESSPLIEHIPGLEIFGGKMPITGFKVILFADDYWSLAVRFVHSLVDGAALANFFKSWAGFYNGIAMPPRSDYSREALSHLGAGPGYRPSLKFRILPPANFSLRQKFDENKKTSGAINVDIPNARLEALIQRCKADSTLELSSSDIIHAIAWKAFAHASPLPDYEACRIYTAGDIKAIKNFGIPDDFEGNTSIVRSAEGSLKAVRALGLEQAAEWFRQQTKPITEIEVRQDIAYLNREYTQGRLRASNGTFSQFIRGSLVDCLDFNAIFVNDMRFLEIYNTTFEEKALWYETVQDLGFPAIYVYRKLNQSTSIRYVGDVSALEPFRKFIEALVQDDTALAVSAPAERIAK